MRKFQFYRQLDSKDCGPTCLRMVCDFHGKKIQSELLGRLANISKEGVNLKALGQAAEKVGMKSLLVRLSFQEMKENALLPLIVHWKRNHFIVVYKITRNQIWIADPAHGTLRLKHDEFINAWSDEESNHGSRTGVALILEPTSYFYKQDQDALNRENKLQFLLKYLLPHKKLIFQLVAGMIVGSLLQLAFPFLTQSLVDKGISHKNLNFVHLILIAQLLLYVGRASVEFLRSWIVLYLGIYINVSILSDFLTKLMRLPIAFFDVRQIGDVLQRINDHKRIETFLTTSVLGVAFSFFNFFVFSIVLAVYYFKIFLVFILGSALYVMLVSVFMKRRRLLDYERFNQLSVQQSTLIQLITGMQDIKLSNSEVEKRWEWESIQAQLFNTNMKSLALNQYQQGSSLFVNEVKNIFITYLSASAVIQGDITLGVMIAIQYIIGQLNSPVNEFISFMRANQDAKISLERLSEIHKIPDEQSENSKKIQEIPKHSDIVFNNVSFSYHPGSGSVLKDISIKIPAGKITAIVGESGSGKTTLMKLLLKFYEPAEGKITIGDLDFGDVDNKIWRGKCGVVMQDGHIFSDTIEKNIDIKGIGADLSRLQMCLDIVNLREYVEDLPMKHNTKIGATGIGLSQGQKQRMLLARALFRNPDYLFLDEATNALDSENERIVMLNLNTLFQNKTVLIIAHRLSTVINADQILVLDKGRVIESGTHDELIRLQGKYFGLVKNQLALGS